MSWDYHIGQLRTESRIKKDELTSKLSDEFNVTQVLKDKNGYVDGFTLVKKGQKDEWEFSRQTEGYFWTSAAASGIIALIDICNTVATKLGWEVNDPQENDEWAEPPRF